MGALIRYFHTLGGVRTLKEPEIPRGAGANGKWARGVPTPPAGWAFERESYRTAEKAIRTHASIYNIYNKLRAARYFEDMRRREFLGRFVTVGWDETGVVRPDVH